MKTDIKEGCYVYMPYDGFDPLNTTWYRVKVKELAETMGGLPYCSFYSYGDCPLRTVWYYQGVYDTLKKVRVAK